MVFTLMRNWRAVIGLGMRVRALISAAAVASKTMVFSPDDVDGFLAAIRPLLAPLYPELARLNTLHCQGRDLRYVDPHVLFRDGVDYNLKMLLVDAQTSGGLLLSCPPGQASAIVRELQDCGYPSAAVIGEIEKTGDGQPAVIVE